MENMLKDHVSIITGGGSGMGEATCQLFASEGAKVIVADYNGENAQKTGLFERDPGKLFSIVHNNALFQEI